MSSRTSWLGLLLAVGVTGMATTASADPCEAIPDGGPLPIYLSFGSTFSGPVTTVIDGDSMCIAVGLGPKNWVEVRLADFYAPESSDPTGPAAKAALERIALGREAVCVANLRTYDRIAARCRIDGQEVGDQLRKAGIVEGGRGTEGRVVSSAPSLSDRPVARGQVFRNCAAAHAAGAAPVRRGEPGYGPHLDRDNDGIGCE